MTRFYLSGPMSGYHEHNAPQFNVAAKMLRERGYEVCNPVEFDESPGLAWSDYLRKDIRALMDCRGVITLPGWQESRGAALEVHIAHALGMTVLPLSVALTMRPECNVQPEGAAAIAGGPATAKETTQRGAVQEVAARAGDDAKPAVGAAAPNGLRVAPAGDEVREQGASA